MWLGVWSSIFFLVCSDWPTIPQVFVNGEFVGGCDIMLQMHASGDLVKMLDSIGHKSIFTGKADEE